MIARMAQTVERVLGKDEVPGPIPGTGLPLKFINAFLIHFLWKKKKKMKKNMT